jgi:ribosomal protein S18 acetylase RimI-like enzyme
VDWLAKIYTGNDHKMSRIAYRQLSREEINKLNQIDRTEIIDDVYYMRDGAYVLEKEHHDVPDWSEDDKQRRIEALQEIFDQGATFYGAFDGNNLVGMSVLDHNPVRSGEKRLNLEGLWVSHPYRGSGIGKKLFQLAAEEARERKAKAMYVSATPSKNTVHFYQRLGCHRAEPVDEYLYNKEPEDIHLALKLVEE